MVGEVLDLVVDALDGGEGVFGGVFGDGEVVADLVEGEAVVEEVFDFEAEGADAAGGFDRPVAVADEVADSGLGEDAEDRGELAFGGIPSAARLDEGDVDAAVDVVAFHGGVLAAELAAHVAHQGKVLAVEVLADQLLVAGERRGEVAPCGALFGALRHPHRLQGVCEVCSFP